MINTSLKEHPSRQRSWSRREGREREKREERECLKCRKEEQTRCIFTELENPHLSSPGEDKGEKKEEWRNWWEIIYRTKEVRSGCFMRKKEWRIPVASKECIMKSTLGINNSRSSINKFCCCWKWVEIKWITKIIHFKEEGILDILHPVLPQTLLPTLPP